MRGALTQWVSGASAPGAVVASIRRHPEKIPAEFDERLKWADSDGSLQVMVSLAYRDENVESLVAANTVDLSWYGDDPRFLGRITPDQLITLLKSPVVMFVEPDYPLTNFMSASSVDVRARTPNTNGVYSFDPSTGPMGRIISNVAGLTAEQVTGAGVRVAITDSGIDKTHRDFGGWDCEAGPYQPCESRIVKTMTVQHLVDPGFEPSDAIPMPTTEAASGHGTHVAGTIAGNGYYSRDGDADPDRYGGDGYVIGIAPNADLISVKNGDSQSAGLSTQALQWQLDHASEFGIRVSSNSWGCLGGCSFNGNSVAGQIFRDLYNTGVVVAFAAGNDGGGADGMAFSGNAQSPYVLGVAAYDDATSQLASFSSRGKSDQPLYDPATWTPESEPLNGTRRPDVAAPGVDIWSARTLTGGTASVIPRINLNDVTGGGSNGFLPYVTMGGTSMATPHVAGTAAVLAGACPAAAPLHIMRAVLAGANPSKVLKTGGTAMAEPFEVGYGGLDVRASLDQLRSQPACGGSGDPDPTPTPTPTPTPSPTSTPSPTPTGTPEPGTGTRYYFHASATSSNTADQVAFGGASFNKETPTFTDPAAATDVPVIANGGPRAIWDPTWLGQLDGPLDSLTVDFWVKAPEEEIQTGEIAFDVSLWTGNTEIGLPTFSEAAANLTGPVRITHQFTTMLEGEAEVPLTVDPAGETFGISIRGHFLNSAGGTILYDALDFPSGFIAGGAGVDRPTPVDTSLLFTDGSVESAQYTDPAHIEARLVDDNGDPISGGELTFELTNDESYTRTFTSTTNEDGIGGVDFDVTEDPGLYLVTARYEGLADTYNGSVDATGFQVTKEDTALALADNGTGKNRALTATLTDGDSSASGIAGQTIEFFANGASVGTAVTGTDGSVVFDPPKKYEGKKTTFTAVFAGDDYYKGSSA
ncbi:MAG: S8 family serine peptidase [Actinomycetota bacterium]